MAKTEKQSSKLQIKSKYNRYFSEAFKRAQVSDIDSGVVTIKEICAHYEVSRTSVYKWLYKYSPHHTKGTNQVVQMKSEERKTQVLKDRIAELEQIIGQKQLEIDYLSKLIEIAGDETGYDFKKNINKQPLNGSGLTINPNDTK